MTDPTNPIPPALSESEWRSVPATIDHVAISGDALVFVGARYGDRPGAPAMVIFPADGFAPIVALANAARRDDDPGKLRQTDVAMLRNVAGDYETPEGYVMTGRLLLALAAKLAALLPPEAK